MRHWLISLAAVAVSALLVGLATDGLLRTPQPLAAWIAFAPWLAATANHGSRGALALGLIMGLAYLIPGRWDVPGIPAQAVSEAVWEGHLWTVGVFLTYALPFALFGWIDGRWLRGAVPLALQPIVRAGVLATLIGVVWTPFPFTPAAMVVNHTAMIQIAEFGGEAWVLWLLLLPSAALAELVRCRGRRAMMSVLGISLLLMFVCWSAGVLRIRYVDLAGTQHPSVSIMAMQFQLSGHSAVSQMTANRSDKNRSAVEQTRNALRADPSCRLAVWPETPLPQARAEFACRRAPVLLENAGVPLLMQCLDKQASVVARLYLPGVQAPLEHTKSALVPVYETTLWRGLMGLGDGPPGTVMSVADGLEVIPAICYEMHSRPHLAAASVAGGNVIAQMSNFTAFGGHVAERYDLAMSRILAVSYRTPIVRSVNGDTAGWIDAAGRLQRLAPEGGPAAQCRPLALPNLGPTLFAQLGAWMAWVPGLFSVTLLVLCSRWRLRGQRARRH